MKNIYIFVILFSLSLSYLFAENAYQIKGKITDSISGEPLTGVRVIVESTTKGALTNKNGEFAIKNLPKDYYKLTAVLIGYKSLSFSVKLEKDENISLKMVDISVSDADDLSIITSPVVVSANKRVQAVQEVPISMSVVESKVLSQRGVTRLDNVLEYLSGIEVNTDNVSIRGSSGFSFGVGSRVALLVDGFPLLSGDAGDIKFDAVPIFNLDRVEVVKGAGSALYGTGALGGVINVLTSAPTSNPVINVRAYSGLFTQPKYEQWRYTDRLRLHSGVNLGYMEKIGDFSVNVSGGYYNNQSYRDFDDSYNWNLFAKIGYDLSDFTNFTLLVNSAAEDRADWVYWRNLDSALIPPAETNKDIRINSVKHSLYSAVRHLINDDNFLNIKAGIFITDFNNNYSLDNPEYRQSHATQLNTEVQMNSKLLSSLELTYGLNFMHISVDSKTYGVSNQQIWSLYAQTEYDGIHSLILTAGGRFDVESADNIDANLQVSPKLGMSYNMYESLNFRASIGNGFRVPTIAERYATVNFQGFKVIPNFNLKPEKSWSFEAGFNYEFSLAGMPVYVDAALFNNELSDLIEPSFSETGAADIQFQNITSARINGLEFTLRSFLFNAFGLETAITYMNPVDLSTNDELKYRPNVLFYNKFVLPLGCVELQADYRFKNKFNNIDPELALIVKDVDARVDIHLVDARIIFDLQKFSKDLPFTMTISANNLLDYYYAEMVGNLGATRYISLRFDGKF